MATTIKRDEYLVMSIMGEVNKEEKRFNPNTLQWQWFVKTDKGDAWVEGDAEKPLVRNAARAGAK